MFIITNRLPPLTLAACLLLLCATASAQQPQPAGTPNDALEAVAFFSLGRKEKESGNHGAAAAAFKRATELKPDWADAYLELGKAYEDSGEPEKFLAAMREAYRLKPDDLNIQLELGHAFRANQKFGDAIAPLKRVAAARPNEVETVYLLGNTQ